VVSLLASQPIQAFASKISELENGLQELVMQKCDKGFVSSLSYPEGFQSQTLFTLCEAAFVFEPDKYAGILYAYQRATNKMGRNIPQSQILQTNDFIIPTSNPFDESRKNLIKRALLNDPDALLKLSMRSLDEPLGLNLLEFSELSLGPNLLLELLFLNEAELRKQAPDWRKFENYLDTYLSSVHFLSSTYSDIAARKLTSIADFILNDYTLVDAAYQIPESMVSKVLAVASFSATLPEDFVWLLRLRVLSPRELSAVKFPGGKSFTDQLPDDVDSDYAFILNDIENALAGLPMVGAHFIEQKLKQALEYEARFPDLRSDYIKYFPRLNESRILDLDIHKITQQFDLLLEGNSDGIKPEIRALLFADVRKIARFPFLLEKPKSEHLKKIVPENLFVKESFTELSSPIDEFIFAQERRKQFQIKSTNLETLSAKISANKSEFCNPSQTLECRKKWGQIDLEWIDLLDSVPDQKCKIQPKYENLIRQTTIAGSPVKDLFYYCSPTDIATILQVPKEDLFEQLPQYLISTGSSSASNFLLNELSLFEGGGLIAAKLYQTAKPKGDLPTPSTSYQLSRVSSPFAWAYLNLVADGPFPNSDKEASTFDINFSSLSEIYSLSGNYERALRAQIQSVEHYVFYANKYGKAFQPYLFEEMVKIKHLLRNLRTPEKLIDKYISETVAKLNFSPDELELNDQKIGLFETIPKEVFKSQTFAYLGLTKPKPFAIKTRDFDIDSGFSFVSNALSTDDFLDNACSDEKTLKALFKPKNEQQHYAKLGAAVWFTSNSIGHEFLDFWHRCATKRMIDLKSNGRVDEIKNLYQRYLTINVPDYLNFDFNFSEPRRIQTFAFWMQAARLNKSPSGVTISLIATDHIYRRLVHSFVFNDSRAFRNQQKNLELIITNADFALSELRVSGSISKHQDLLLSEKLVQLKTSFKTILSSQKKRERLLGLQRIGAEKNQHPFNQEMQKTYSGWPTFQRSIGIQFSLVDGRFFVTRSLNGGTYYRAGLSENYEITSLNGIPTKGMDTAQLSEKIKLSSNNKVNLGLISPSGRALEAELVKESRPLNVEFELQRQRKQFTKANTEIKLATDTLQYFQKLALKADFQSDLNTFPYEGFEYFNWSKRSQISGLPVVQLSSHEGEVLIDLFDIDGKLHQYRVSLNSDQIKSLKNEFLSVVEPSDDTISSACGTFEPIHKITKRHLTNSAIVIPSVNLLPIPSAIVIGSHCNQSSLSLIQSSDLSGALSFAQNTVSRARPNTFIGIGNPHIKPISDQTVTAKFIRDPFATRGLQIKPVEFPRLPEATDEINELRGQFEKSQVFLEEQASLMKALQAASKMSMEKDGVALVLATHGLIPNAERGLFLPRLLSVENNKTVLISNSDIEAVYLPNSVIFLSACDTASGLTETPDLFFTGFVESFANSGSDLIMASLWPVHSMTSKKVTTSFFEAWKTKSIMDSIGAASKSVEKQKRFLPFVFILP